MSLQQIAFLTLLDLSAAFDTMDHFILLERLSTWFGITSTAQTALSWIKSYQLICFSYVNVFQLLYGIPQRSFLGPLLFILYTTPLDLSYLLYLIHLQSIICMRMILNFSCQTLLLTLHIISVISNYYI
jgi:hypothetical protein